VAKIERAEAVASDEALDAIICASDAVMVARGDLGVEIGDAKLMGVQKKIINRARCLNRAVITATQMMETMIHSPLPTRAEVMDVANAVLDGTDAVMLSAETASGKYPVQTVDAMARVILGAELERSIQKSNPRMDENFVRTDEAISMATMYTANHLDGVQAIICMSESGSAPLQMSRISSGIPICAFSRHPATQRKVALYRGVLTTPYYETEGGDELTWQSALQTLKQAGVLCTGDKAIVTHGEERHVAGGTNTMKIVEVH
jgi:pyruvate kinase